jgi:hypothetical protein
MRVNRRFLYAGVFLLAIGAVLVAADLGVLDTAALTNALRLWPLALIAIGVGLVIRRTQYSLAAGVVAAALPGLLLGGLFAVGPRTAADCGGTGEPANAATEQGMLAEAATVSVTGGCGSLTVTTAPGNGWRLRTANSAGQAPRIQSSTESLSVEASGAQVWPFRTTGRNTWDLTLPTSQIESLSMVVYAGRGQVALPAAQIGRFALTANAAEIVVDASEASSIRNLSAAVRVGKLSLQLPNSDVAGSLRVGGGRLEVCAPPGLGLRVTSTGFPRQLTVAGEHANGSEWQSPDYATAAHRADLNVSVNLGNVEINPIGGCR